MFICDIFYSFKINYVSTYNETCLHFSLPHLHLHLPSPPQFYLKYFVIVKKLQSLLVPFPQKQQVQLDLVPHSV